MAYVVSQRGVRALSRLVRGSSSAGTATFSPATISPDDFASPFAVQWAQSVDTSGAWIIWLPSASLVILDGTPLDITSALSAAGGDYPAGWYKLPSALLPDAGGTLYLLVTLPQGATPASAAFSASAGSSGQWTIPICAAAKDATTDARTVKQYVSSALVFGGAGGGTAQAATVVTAIALREVSTGNYQLQVKTTPLTFAGTAGSESAWTTVFETVPHSANPIV